ncbi:MAG: hydantoinase/oxoprolinase family protein [Alphaproteobacteria bacterium]
MNDPLLLGLDTGGTFTDAALCREDGTVEFAAKSLTTKADLSIGIGKAIDAVLSEAPEDALGRIALVSISTTLATNAVVESHGQPVCLVMIGQTESALERAGLREAIGNDPTIFVGGGHNNNGDEKTPLDTVALKAAIETCADRVSAFAISSQFASRNPSHEIAARNIVRDVCGKPVTCGHELSSNLDMPRRALTAFLNARLVPLITELIAAVSGFLAAHDIDAPVMVVRGDGSLMTAETALEKPVETVMSGPAASVVGARYLTGDDDLLVVDMGGTTTDIALMRDGAPILNPDGAAVAGWRTMVEAIAVHTVGLGGDSEISIADSGGLRAGPRRAVPLSLLAMEYPDILEDLKEQRERGFRRSTDARFLTRLRKLDGNASRLSAIEQSVWDRLADGPVAFESLIIDRIPRQPIQRLVDRGLAIYSGFTPSDAAHVLGRHDTWSKEAAIIGAEIWAEFEPKPNHPLAGSAEQFANLVFEQVIRQSGEAILTAILEDEGLDLSRHARLPLIDYLMARAFADKSDTDSSSLLELNLKFRLPIAGVGAPAATYYPALAERTGSALRLPEFGHVANAVGAVVGGVTQRHSILISSPADGRYRAHLPEGVRDFVNLEEAAALAMEVAQDAARKAALAAGASAIEMKVERNDRIVTHGDGVTKIFIDSMIIATAKGRPRLGR